MDRVRDESVPLQETGATTAETPAQNTPSTTPYPRHIRLPFDLNDSEVKIEGNVRTALERIFPETTYVLVGAQRNFISFIVKRLPDSPLPLTVGGLPVTISDQAGNGKGPLFPTGVVGNLQLQVCMDLNARRILGSDINSFRQFADSVTSAISDIEVYRMHPEVEFILSSNHSIYVVLPDGVDIPAIRLSLPGKIAQVWARYLNEKDLGRPRVNQASRAILPNPTQQTVDETPYDVLRPGVALFSPQTLDWRAGLTTTSGVLVESQAGRFMTAASHGIGKYQNIFQKLPLGGRRSIGKPVHEITCTDVAIVKLEDGIEFKNEAFHQADEPAPGFTSLLGEKPEDAIDRNLEVYLNSPFTGTLAGCVVATSWKVRFGPPDRLTQLRLDYTVYQWLYKGQEGVSIPDSVCGSAIWDSEGRIIGFFQFSIQEGDWQGFCACVSADEVVRAGYRLAL